MQCLSGGNAPTSKSRIIGQQPDSLFFHDGVVAKTISIPALTILQNKRNRYYI